VPGGGVIKEAARVAVGDVVEVLLQRGQLTCRVEQKTEE
jgi:ribosomal 50S subunit-recycling heat shock protein